ncbi:uncharacterized protein LOC128318536 [Pangasianodon hypophthalmus]|uniref:uncharacterized protein LOC128318536 n=1 Tax=Pangasianodon hypophthalmus TaxID=310915 RepID=UPI002306E82D|nr:uncharacterized protein LOC128318536 [Pangasianodon hypophthalmus]
MVLGPDFPPRRLRMGDSDQEGSPLTGGGPSSPPPGAVEAVGVASEGAQLRASGLSTEVVETILQSRAPSTRKLYALKWKLFTSWCGDRRLDPVHCPVGTVLEFLQARLSTGLTHSTLKVYVAAIAACHAPLDGQSVGRHPWVTRFLRGALRIRPPARSRVPSWDLAVVLEALCKPPFEPIEEISDRLLTLKTAFLLAISSLRRVGDLQALSVAPSYLDFAPGLAKAFLYPRAGYVPKVPSSAPRPVVLQAFCPPPFREPDHRKLNCTCPVRALDAYVHRTALWRKADQLLVCFGPPKRGFPASKQTLSRWIVESISLAFKSSGLPSPLGVKAHSTRAVAASKAFLTGVSLQDICNAAGWSTPLTFARFYDLDTRAVGIHKVCVVCLGVEHAQSALEGANCPHCGRLPLHVLHSRKALFEKGAFTSVPRGAGPVSAEAERRLHSWGSQLDLVEGMEMGQPLSSSSPTRYTARSLGSEACAASSPRGEGSTRLLSSSEEVDVAGVDEDSPPQFPQYEELFEVVTRAVAQLNIDWPAEKQAELQTSRLDERFQRSKPPPPRRSLPLFPDLHTKVSRSWGRLYSAHIFSPASSYYANVVGLSEHGYRAMPRVEQTLASYLSTGTASSLKAPALPSKPLQTSSALVGKGYTAAGQACACLHTMALLQAYQAVLLREQDECGEMLR